MKPSVPHLEESASAVSTESGAVLEAVLEATSDAMLVIGPDGSVEASNRAFRRLWNVAEDSGPLTVAGVCAAMVDQLVDPEAARDRILALLAAAGQCGQGETLAHGGRVLEYRWQPRFVDGAASGGVLVFSDLTNQRRATERLGDALWVNSALSRLRRNLEWSSDVSVMLHRLCRATCETMGCDASHTYLLRPEEQDFALVAGHGDGSEQWQMLREVQLPRDQVAGLIAALEQDEIFEVRAEHLPDSLREKVRATLMVETTLFIALRRGSELIGFHTACLRRPGAAFAERQMQLARGVAPLVSLALENAVLVQELTRSGRRKAEFVTAISHEIRTPLHVILGWTSLLLEESIMPQSDEFRDVLGRIDRSGKQIADVLEAATDLNRVDVVAHDKHDSETSLEDVFRDVEREMRPECESSGLAFGWSFERNLPTVFGERDKVRVVLRHLIENALRFTRAGNVIIAARRRAGGVELAVSDTGIGLGPQALSGIFEPFQAVGQPVRGEASGTGLGLHAVQSLVETLGGEIEVESEVGVGSTFRVWLPAAPEAYAAHAS